ncbi:MAG: hypothetical protein OEU92_20665 [Alphaproteobacteria bacterium]|nr:hypothetical protein [Alphaproteobacteria bacterium]
MKWQDLSARSKRWVTIGCAVAGVALFSWAVASGTAGGGKTKRQAVNEAILTDADTRQATLDRLAAQLESSRSENADLARKVETLSERQQKLPESVASQIERAIARGAQGKEQALERRLKQLETALERAEQRGKDRAKVAAKPSPADEAEEKAEPGAQPGPVISASTSGIVFPENGAAVDSGDPASIFDQTPTTPAGGGKPELANPSDASPGEARIIRFVSEKDGDAAIEGNQALPAVGENLFKLPTTSILTGTLITGLDAPTGAQAQGEPLPVLLRLKKEAILPNRFKADVRECFALLGAYGDLSSERAHMRGETMSCVLNDGTILESPLKAFAVGEDGKEGTRGRLVRREGTFIARALLVGFLEAAANAFDSNQVVQIGGAGLDVQGAQAAATSVGASTAGNALGRVADWYIDQAFQLFPVIEIDAGREIDVVLTGAFEMNLPLENG